MKSNYTVTAFGIILMMAIFSNLFAGVKENKSDNYPGDRKIFPLHSETLNESLALKGELLFMDNFNIPMEYTKDFQPIKNGWKVKVAHATWKQTRDGIQSIWETGHMPVLVYSGLFDDAVIEIDFRFQRQTEAEKWAACRISATNTELNPRAYSASVWANADGKARTRGMVLEHDEWQPGEIITVDTLYASFEPDKWYTLRMEIIGNQVLATCNGVQVSGTHEKFGIQKNSIYLGVGTCKHELRNFKVYKAVLNPAWNRKKNN